jgi:hypothetical protein
MFEDKNCHYCGAEYSSMSGKFYELLLTCSKRNCILEFAYQGPESRFALEIQKNDHAYYHFIDRIYLPEDKKLYYISSYKHTNQTNIFEINDFGKQFLFSFDFYIEPISIKQIKSDVLSALKLKQFT